jgi:hypothetical protein
MEISMAGLQLRPDYAPSNLRTCAAREKDCRAADLLLWPKMSSGWSCRRDRGTGTPAAGHRFVPSHDAVRSRLRSCVLFAAFSHAMSVPLLRWRGSPVPAESRDEWIRGSPARRAQ